MKKLFTLCLLLAATRLFALTGGPDQFGYTWKDSNEPGGPIFHWIDIVASDREIYGLGDDNVRGPYSLTTGGYNPFTFYWYKVDTMWIGSNGYISFGDIMLASQFPPIPDPTNNKYNFITGILADLTFAGVGNTGHCYARVTTDSVVVSWINVPFYSSNYPYYTGSSTFQIILDKIDKSITINFQSCNGTTLTGDIRTGMENYTGNIGLQPFAYTYPPANYTIKYYYPTALTYFVTDGAAKWNTKSESRGLFLASPSTFTLKADIANTGNIDIPPVYTATGRVNDYNGVNAVTTSVNFPDTLRSGKDTVFTYPSTFTPPATGTYSYTTHLTGVQNDGFSSNDSLTQELVVIDTALTSYQLNYSDNTAESNLSWTDGTGGAGYYFVPPSYPVKVTSTKFYIDDNPNGARFIAKIFADNGPNGTPGTMLDSVMSPVPFVGGYNLIPTVNNVVITHGGVYVLWEMYGIGIALGTDLNPPFSLRSFEYVANLWSEYRNSESEDFLIGMICQKTAKEDISVTKIVSPLNNAFISSPTMVRCWLKNPGQLAETNFKVSYRLLNGTPVTEMYTGPAIAPHDSTQFTFITKLQPGLGVTGSLCVYSDLTNDFNRTNDTLCISVQIAASVNDIGVSSIVSPANGSTIYTTTTISCYVKNYGQLSESNFFVNYKLTGETIITQAYTGTPKAPGDSLLFNFNTQIQSGTGTSGPFCVWTNLGNDINPANDTACISVHTIAAVQDIGVSKILNPLNNTLIDSAQTVACRIKNYGQVADSTFNVSYKLSGVAAVTEPFTTGVAIQPGDSAQFSFATKIQPGVGLTGIFKVYTTMASDATHANDTAFITLQTTYGIDEFSQNSGTLIYPNPFDDYTIISWSNHASEAYELSVFDMLGNLVIRQAGIKAEKYILYRQQLPQGIYLLRLSGETNVYNARIVVR